MCVGDGFHIRSNSELYELFNDVNVVHVVRMGENAPARRIFEAEICRKEICVGSSKSTNWHGRTSSRGAENDELMPSEIR